ncbi:hornerin-like [Littorina saxatilis]|uniref:hornerin-like n=1 Tax=Littorina saxatilis TaxID=31220 RepID=UPI0038B6816B
MLGNTGRKWKTFDGGSTVEHEGEGGATRWRLSLHGRRSNSFTALLPPLDTAGGYSTQPCPPYSHTDSLQQENSSIMDKLNDDDEILEVVIESQARHDSPPDSPGYLPNDSPPDNPGYRLNDSPPDSPGYLPNDSPPDSPEYLHNDSPPDSHGYLHNEDEVLGETHRDDSWGSEPETSTGGEKGQRGGREREACDGEKREACDGETRRSEGQTSDCVREREACDGETRRMSEGQTSDCVSDDYTASSTMKSKFRGNLSRQHRVGNTAKPTTYTITTTSTAGTNTTTATSRHTNTNNKPFINTTAETTATTSHPATTSATTIATFTSRDSATGGTESHRFRTIHKQKPKSRSSSASANPPVAIVTPKAKTNKGTQVNYPQIKEETGWKPPGVRLHRRKKYVKVIGSYSTSPVTLKPYQSDRKTHPDHGSNYTAVDQASKENRAAYNSKAFKGCLPVNATLNRSPGNSSVSNNTRLLHESRQYGASNNATQSVWHSQREGNAVSQSKQHSVYDDATASRVSNRIVEGVASNGEPYNTDVSPESCRNRKLRLASTEESGDNEQKKQHNHSTALSDQQKKTDCTLKSDANKSARFCRQSSISQAQGHDTQGMQGTRTVSTAPDSEATAHVRHHTTAAKTDTDPALSTPSNPSSDYSGCESTDSSARGDQLNRSSGNRSHHQRANARLHPYARARSDPQFSRNPDLPCDAVGRVPLAAARGSPLGRPPRPHADHVLAWVERSALGHDDLHEQPERQSTVDTLDSGIENESPIYGSYFVSGHRRLHRQPYPWSIDLDPSLIRASGAADDLFSGHRRLSRRSYPWEMAVDHPVTVTPGSPGSGSTTDGGHDEDDLHLTLGNVIEAAVHRSVCKILSGSSSPGSHSSLPSFALQPGDRKRKKGEGGNSDSYRSSEPSLPYHLKGRESRGRSDSKHSDVPSLSWRGEAAGQSAFSRRRSLLSDQAGSDDTGWCSDSELYVKRDDLLLHHEKLFSRRPKGGHTGSTLNRASSDVKEDFFRSVAILADSQASVWLQRPISPDFGESKSDGRYSPYSVTDIPCFELPSGATKIRRHGSRSSSHFPHFPHQHHPPATAPSSHAPPSQSRAHLTKDKPGCSQLHCLQPQGLPHTRPTSHSVSKVQGVRQPVVNPPPSSSSSFSSSSSSKPLVLRRQTGVGGKGVSSPDMLSTSFAMVEPEQRHRHRSEMLLSSSSSSSSSGKHGQSEPVSTAWGTTSAKKVNGKSDDGGTVDTNRLPGHATLATDTNILDPSLWLDLEGTMKGQTGHELWLGAVPSEAATFLSHRSNVERSAKPRIIIHPSDVTPRHSELAQTLSTSTEDSSSYCGFGISRTQRTDLLDHLRHFRDLTDMGQKRDFPDDGSAGRGCSISPSSMDGLCLTGSPLGCLSPSSDPFDETSPLSSASLFANNSFFQQDDLGTFDRTDEIGERSALGSGHLSVRGSLASTEIGNWDSDSASGRETNHVICNSGATLGSDDRLGSDLSSCGTERLDSGSDRLGSDLSSCGTERLDRGRDRLGSDLSSCGRERLDSGRDRLGSDLSSCGTERLDSGRDRLGSDLSSCGRERLDSGSSLGQDLTLSPIQPRVAHASLNGVHFSEACPSAGNDVIEAPDVGRCMAFGAGLSFGQLGVQNNFQVWTEREDSGCVTVAVFGHRSHCVTDTSVTYIGDNLYDVTFSVTSPGYYVIVVKCGEESLPDSPYICTVTN